MVTTPCFTIYTTTNFHTFNLCHIKWSQTPPRHTNVMLFTGLYTVTVLHIKWLKTSPCFSLSFTLSPSLHKTTTEKPRGRSGDLEGDTDYLNVYDVGCLWWWWWWWCLVVFGWIQMWWISKRQHQWAGRGGEAARSLTSWWG